MLKLTPDQNIIYTFLFESYGSIFENIIWSLFASTQYWKLYNQNIKLINVAYKINVKLFPRPSPYFSKKIEFSMIATLEKIKTSAET